MPRTKFIRSSDIVVLGCTIKTNVLAEEANSWWHHQSKGSWKIYRSTSLCQTCLSRIHGLCRSDHPFRNFSPILHCNSTLLMSNSVIMKTQLFRSVFHSLKPIFPLFTTACIEVVKKWNGPMTNKVIYLIDRTIALISAQIIHCCK